MAVWVKSNIDNRYTLFLVLPVVLSGFTMGAPAAELNSNAWWTHPCTATLQLRHARSGRSSVRTQIKIMASNLNTTVLPNLRLLYEKKPLGKIQRSTCPKVNAVLTQIKNAKTVKEANFVFYDSLVELAKFINETKHIPVFTKGKFDHDKRKDIYDEIEINLRSVLCDVHERLVQHRAPPRDHKKKIHRIRNLLTTKCLPKSMDLTKAQFLDFEVINKIKRFLKQGLQNIKEVKKSKRRHLRKGNAVTKFESSKRKTNQKLRKNNKRKNNERTKHKFRVVA